VAAGGLWAALAALPRAYLRADEVISTLMLNFVALHFMNYLIFGSESFWRDKDPFYAGFPSGRVIPEVAQLPRLWLRLHAGFLIAIAAALVLWWLLRVTRWGFDIRVIGDSPAAARYAGMPVSRRLVSVLVVSGAIAGLAGGVLLTGSTHALQPNGIAVGTGYTGIVVAAVSRMNPLGVVPVSILIAGLTNSGSSLQAQGIPNEIVVLLQGLVLLLVAAAEFFLHNRVRFGVRGVSPDVQAAA
jgi:simple sugar transport system permease protein